MKIQNIIKSVAVTGLFLIAQASNSADCDKHLVFGIPAGGDGDKVLCYSGFALSYDYEMKVPSWVSYTLTKQSVHGTNVKRKNNFKIDRNIPRQFASSGSDYSKSGYDRGHMAGSAQIDYSRAANDETFLYSNMAPQLAGFNRNMMGHKGSWGRIEDLVRKWIYKRESLNVISGTYFDDSPTFIGNGVGIPTAFYKIVIDTTSGDSISFWLPHVENTAFELASNIVSINDIESLTGIDFLSKIPDHLEDYIEGSVNQLSDF
jgi:endonuclease G